MTRTHFRSIAIALSVAATGMGAVLYAQIQGDRGVPPISSESDFAVPGVKVDVSGDSGAQARDAAWRLAQRQGWRMLWQKMNPGTAVPALADSALQGLVSGCVVANEQTGPSRTIVVWG